MLVAFSEETAFGTENRLEPNNIETKPALPQAPRLDGGPTEALRSFRLRSTPIFILPYISGRRGGVENLLKRFGAHVRT